MKRLFAVAAMLMCLTAQASAENYPYRSDYLWTAVPNHADWLYACGEKASVEVQLFRYGVPVDETVSYTIGNDMLADDQNGTVRLKNGRATIDMGTRRTPGFRDLRLMATVDGK